MTIRHEQKISPETNPYFLKFFDKYQSARPRVDVPRGRKDQTGCDDRGDKITGPCTRCTIPAEIGCCGMKYRGNKERAKWENLGVHPDVSTIRFRLALSHRTHGNPVSIDGFPARSYFQHCIAAEARLRRPFSRISLVFSASLDDLNRRARACLTVYRCSKVGLRV